MGQTTSNMLGGATGKLQKLKIQAFSDPEYRKPIPNMEFTTLVNPDKYVINNKVDYYVPEVITDQNQPYYRNTPPQEMEFEFLFDDTGVFDETPSFQLFKSRPSNGIESAIKKFNEITWGTNSKTHRPNYLRISWGSLTFEGILSEVSIEYKLFAPDAKPLRAIAKAKFKKFIEPKKAAADTNKSSPDLTHVRIVEEGDTLPLMTERIYGDSKYYLEVARVNKLVAFRKLKAGQRLFFPPIQKPD